MEPKIKKIHLAPAKCAVDMSDGSERGEYVNQDYILRALGRPHRCVNIMYCYYPLDKEFPNRISEVMKDADISFQWDYPYDDYFTYKGGLEGNTEGEPFTCMRDIRRHGQDVALTLTVDPHVSDEQLIAVAKDLVPFGRMMLRINHEATGNWFSFNKRCTYQEVADFYVRFHRIIKQYAPNVTTILCIGGIEHLDSVEMEKEKEFTEAVRETDVWSTDKYISLHYGWPFDVAERGGATHRRDEPDEVFELTKRTYERFKYLNGGVAKPMVMSELNADGDVVGPYEQAQIIEKFYSAVKNEKADWLSGIVFYQFRDRGRLGLEAEDPNCSEVGIPQPEMQIYKKIIHDDYFKPNFEEKETVQFPAKLRWGSFEDSDGISIPLHFDKDPVFCEVNFEEAELNLMLEINGSWFYKAPGVKTVDLMSAFFEKPIGGESDLTVKIFAPPASGENDPSQGDDWTMNYYCVMNKAPQFRIRYEPTELGKTTV